MSSIAVGLLLSALATGSCSLDAPAPPTEGLLQPNLVLVVIDDLGREGLGVYGGQGWETPHLDRLAAEGMVFDHFYSTPVCGDSRAQIATGQYTFRTGLSRHALDPALAPPSREGSGAEMRLVGLLQDRGYETIFAGKKHVPRALRDAPGVPELSAIMASEGWHHYAWALANLEGEKQAKYWGGTLLRDGTLERLPSDAYTPDVLFGFVEEQLARLAGGDRAPPRPFFLQYSLLLAHAPHEPTPATASGASDRLAPFPELVRHLDGIVGRLASALEQKGLAERTLLLVVSDNGSGGRVRAGLLGASARGGKRHLTDSGTRVPAVAWWPGVVAPGRNANLVDLTDVLPTFLALADGALAGRPVETPPGVDGVSFADQLGGGDETGRRWHFNQFDEGGTRYYMRDRRWKLYQDGSLYDLETDPGEERAILPGSDSRESARARAFLRDRLRELNPHFVEPRPASS